MARKFNALDVVGALLVVHCLCGGMSSVTLQRLLPRVQSRFGSSLAQVDFSCQGRGACLFLDMGFLQAFIWLRMAFSLL